MQNNTFYSMSVAVALFGAVFSGFIGAQLAFFVWLLLHCLLHTIAIDKIIGAATLLLFFVPIFAIFGANATIVSQTPLYERFATWALYLLAISGIVYAVRSVRLSQLRSVKQWLKSTYNGLTKKRAAIRKDKAMVNNTTSELGHLTASRINSSMTLSQIERISAEMTMKHPELDLTHEVMEVDVLDEIYSNEQDSVFTGSLLERDNSLSKKYFGRITALTQRLPKINMPSLNLLSRRLQSSEAGHITFAHIDSPIAQSIASQITPATTIAQIEQLSKATRRPNTIWGTSERTER